MQSHLFVYGSLLSAAKHPNGARLRSESLLIGPATIAGRLYRVSWYPALRPAVAANNRVHGEVYKLTDAAGTLAWLDEYEGITQGPGSGAAADEYARAEQLVVLASGATLTVWVYLYQRMVPEAGWIADGLWRG